MGGDRPKQYLPLGASTVIEHSLLSLLSHPRISGAVIALAAQDNGWPALEFHHPKPLWIATGGAERCHSVQAALSLLAQHAAPDDWVLVHDAARPCVRAADIDRLIRACSTHDIGGILAVPVRDTLKRQQLDTRQPAIRDTVDRDGLWQAQTPQMFRLGTLRQALHIALKDGARITDEASAMEWVGYAPLLVEGHADNLKITTPEDLALAEFILGQLPDGAPD